MSSTSVLSVESLYETTLPGVTPHRRGKVRDMLEVGDDHLLMIATDRISAYDVVLGSVIPDKGKVLTQLSAFWFARTSDLVPNHLVSMDPAAYPEVLRPYANLLAGRSMLVRRTQPLPIECVARGYLSGSGWKEYRQNGQVCGVALPAGLTESDRLPEPIFTPATKAETGHDINISEAEAGEIVGTELVARLRELTLALYRHGAEHAGSRGIIVADTKFEFGLVDDENRGEAIVLIDEVLTPDSSPVLARVGLLAGRWPAQLRQAVRARLPRPDPVGPTSPGTRTSGRCRREHAGEVHRGPSAVNGTGTRACVRRRRHLTERNSGGAQGAGATSSTKC